MYCQIHSHLCIRHGVQTNIYKLTKMEIHPQKNIRHVKANVNPRNENQDNQNISNEVEDIMLKGHPLPQINE